MRLVNRYIVLQIVPILFVPLIANAQHTSGVTVYHAVKADEQVMPLLAKSKPDSISEPAVNISITDNIDELLSATNGDYSIVDPYKKQLFPDQEAYQKAEQYRFELLLAHWDVPVEAVTLP